MAFAGLARTASVVDNQLAKISISLSSLTTPVYGGSDDEVTAITVPKATFYNLGFAEMGSIQANFGENDSEVEFDDGQVKSTGTGFSLQVMTLNQPTLLDLKDLKENTWDVFIQDPTVDTVSAATYTGEGAGAMTAGSNLYVIRECGVVGGIQPVFGKDPIKAQLTFARRTMKHITEDVGEAITITLS